MISLDFSRTKIWPCAEDQRKEEERLFEIEFRVTEFVIQSIPIAHPIYLKNHDVFIRITALHIFQFKNYKGGYTAPVSMSNCTGYTDAGTRKLCRHRDHVEKKKKKKKEDPFLTFVAQVVPPPRGVYPLIYHDPWLQWDEGRREGDEEEG